MHLYNIYDIFFLSILIVTVNGNCLISIIKCYKYEKTIICHDNLDTTIIIMII